MIWQYPNPNLKIGGIFLTLFDKRRNEDKLMQQNISVAFENINLFETKIPYSVKVSERSVQQELPF